MVTEDRSRGQVILIGAITLAFIILGVVVVFNGVLYTETLSSGTSSQSASTAEVTTTEVEQSVACLTRILNDRDEEDQIESRIDDDWSVYYRETTAQSTPSIVDVSYDDHETHPDPSIDDIVRVDVTLTYDSRDLRYERELEIEPNDCPDTL